MSSDPVEYVLVAFNCKTCGGLLCVNNHNAMSAVCENCGAGYDLNDTVNLVCYYKGRPPNQWHSNGWDGETQNAEGVH